MIKLLRKYLLPVLVLAAAPVQGAEGERHGLFTEILRDHVVDGRVDYARLCEDERLKQYLSQLSATDPESLPDEDARHAFWINVYNAFTLDVICSEYPVESINELHFGGRIVGHVLNKTVWDRKFIVVSGKELSLNDVEHEIIRPRFKDYRSHFALVCAAKSCPPLRSEAFEGSALDGQLDGQGEAFFSQSDKNRFDRSKRVAYLSKILDWYGGDFGSSAEDVLLAVADYLPDDVADDIRRDPGAWKIRYTEYDWSLNE